MSIIYNCVKCAANVWTNLCQYDEKRKGLQICVTNNGSPNNQVYLSPSGTLFDQSGQAAAVSLPGLDDMIGGIAYRTDGWFSLRYQWALDGEMVWQQYYAWTSIVAYVTVYQWIDTDNIAPVIPYVPPITQLQKCKPTKAKIHNWVKLVFRRKK